MSFDGAGQSSGLEIWRIEVKSGRGIDNETNDTVSDKLECTNCPLISVPNSFRCGKSSFLFTIEISHSRGEVENAGNSNPDRISRRFPTTLPTSESFTSAIPTSCLR